VQVARRGHALHAFEANEEDELQLTKGQVVYLLGKAEKDWFIGRTCFSSLLLEPSLQLPKDRAISIRLPKDPAI